MEQKIIIVEGQYLDNLNKLLEEGWKVEHIAPFSQSVTRPGAYETYGNYGAYVVLQKEKKELTTKEVETILATKGIGIDSWD